MSRKRANHPVVRAIRSSDNLPKHETPGDLVTHFRDTPLDLPVTMWFDNDMSNHTNTKQATPRATEMWADEQHTPIFLCDRHANHDGAHATLPDHWGRVSSSGALVGNWTRTCQHPAHQ
jgi:hypothetical protein